MPNNFTKLFCFSEKLKTFAFQSILLNGFLKYFWIWPEIGFGFTKWLWYFSKNNEYIYKMVSSFFGKCYLIDSKMIEPYRMVYKIPGNLKISAVFSTKWFVK